jgi:uncharacterized membrane protein
MSRTRSRNKARKARSQAQAGQQKQQAPARGGRPVGAAARPAGTAARTTARPGAPRPNGGVSNVAAEAPTSGVRPGAAASPAVADGPPAWLRLTTFLLSITGLGVSIYLTIVHYSTAVSLACPNTGTVNCEKVITSPQSVIAGIPVAVLGLAFFVFMVAVNNPLAWRSPLRAVHLGRVLSVIVGIVFVIYLVYVEVFKVNAICLWCTSVHVITFVLFVLILLSAATWGLTQRSQ